MSNNYRIVICSYNRPETIQRKTLAYLLKTNVNPKKIDIFVADDAQYAVYRKALGPNYNLIIGKKGMKAIRNFVSDYYSDGQKIFVMDDDVEALNYKSKDMKLALFTDLHNLILHGFEICKNNNARLWGVYPVNNAFFMRGGISFDLKYIVGAVWGCINSRDAQFQLSFDDKEDYERSIKFYEADGVVVRYNFISVKTNYYKEKGGMQDTRTTDSPNDSAKLLLKKYPYYVSLKNKKVKEIGIILRDKRAEYN